MPRPQRTTSVASWRMRRPSDRRASAAAWPLFSHLQLLAAVPRVLTATQSACSPFKLRINNAPQADKHVHSRSASPPAKQDTKLIYRHFATLYFVVLCDKSESELGILDLIQGAPHQHPTRSAVAASTASRCHRLHAPNAAASNRHALAPACQLLCVQRCAPVATASRLRLNAASQFAARRSVK